MTPIQPSGHPLTTASHREAQKAASHGQGQDRQQDHQEARQGRRPRQARRQGRPREGLSMVGPLQWRVFCQLCALGGQATVAEIRAALPLEGRFVQRPTHASIRKALYAITGGELPLVCETKNTKVSRYTALYTLDDARLRLLGRFANVYYSGDYDALIDAAAELDAVK